MAALVLEEVQHWAISSVSTCMRYLLRDQRFPPNRLFDKLVLRTTRGKAQVGPVPWTLNPLLICLAGLGLGCLHGDVCVETTLVSP